MAYTVENRGKILRALYTILRANPQLRQPKAQKTRFKTWWHLVGSALEHAAGCMVEWEQAKDSPAENTAEPVDFGAIFRTVEEDDEEAASLGDALDALHDVWPTGYFAAGDVIDLIECPKDGETLKAARVKAFFHQQCNVRNGDTLTSMRISKRLSVMLDTPVDHEGKTLKLVRKATAEGARREAAAYHARIL